MSRVPRIGALVFLHHGFGEAEYHALAHIFAAFV